MKNSKTRRMALSPAREREVARRFKKHVRKQVRKLRRTYTAASSTNDAQAVHDLRVATRRLQTVLDLATFSKPKKSARKARKELKQLRHVLSVRRDTDVLAATMRSRATRAASAHRTRLWNRAARETRGEGERAARKSERWLKSYKVSRLAARIKKIAAGSLNDGFSSSALGPDVQRAQQRWNQTVREASARTDSSRFHDVRIKTKSLRYMTELVSGLIGSDRSKGADRMA
jgi:CHAD domain-containing protein